MPNEIQVHILCYLDISEILSLRITSKPLWALVQLNASILSRIVLRSSSLGCNPLFLDTLYPPPLSMEKLDYFLQMMHRERTVSRMVATVADYVQTKIYLIRSTSRRKQFAASRARMENGMKASTFVIYHFLEKFRIALVRDSQQACGDSGDTSAIPLSLETEMQREIINGYPEDVLLPAFQFYRIMVSAYRQKLRPPTYAGTLERKLRGWDRTPASDADVAQVLIYGGMEEVLEVMLQPTYGARLQALNLAIDQISGSFLPTGATWTEGMPKPRFISELDIPALSNIKYMSQGSTMKLTALYLPWLSAIVAKRRKLDGTEATLGEQMPATQMSGPQIPSPFTYIEDLIKDDNTGAASGGIGITVEDIAARANAPDEDVDDDAAAVPTDATHAPTAEHRSLSFPTQYG
jgi:F-box domain